MPTVTKNKRLKRLLKAIDRGLYNFPFDKTLKEAQKLHKDMNTREMTAKSLRRGHVDKLVSAQTQNQAFRSRIVELLVQVSQFQHNLTTEYELVRDYLVQKYPDEFGGRTKDDRMRPVNLLFEPVIRLLKQYELLEDNLKLIIADFDRAERSIRNIIEILRLTQNYKEYRM